MATDKELSAKERVLAEHHNAKSRYIQAFGYVVMGPLYEFLSGYFHTELEAWQDAASKLPACNCGHGVPIERCPAKAPEPTGDDTALSTDDLAVKIGNEMLANLRHNVGAERAARAAKAEPKAPDVTEVAREHLCETGVRCCAWQRVAEKAEKERDAALEAHKQLLNDYKEEIKRSDQLQRDLDDAKELLGDWIECCCTNDPNYKLPKYRRSLCKRADNLLK